MLINSSATTDSMILLVWFFLFTKGVLGEGEVTEQSGAEDAHPEVHAAHAVLYPSFVLTLSVIVYYFLSRFFHRLPYTAIMFLLGVVMGFVSSPELFLRQDKNEYMRDTLLAWQGINSEVLLLVFLPGLIFKDALGQNPYLFAIGSGQLLIFAFPMVLAGTYLTACIGKYVFLRYEWSFSLCLTFGSILAATDPVAVAALLEEVGAPPRLTTHIAGESLLNDGAAIVFFSIFSKIFFNEIGITGSDEEINFGEGVKLFVQKAIGGSAIGLVAGGTIILCLSSLNRRFGKEENVVQVIAVFGLVYLNYFVADLICATSGVIATLIAGLCVKFFGRGAINNIHLMDEFFSITEHILNTILFSLGGLVWGSTLYTNHVEKVITAKDWGYLVILYVLLHVIRALLFAAAYPITVRIGLKTNWQETLFQVYGGLRGAVGIALALALDNELGDREDLQEHKENIARVYFMVGGIAFMTLVINGATAGPLLKWLGLADSTETREKIIEAYRIHMRATVIDSFVMVLTHEKFKSIDFSFVQDNIPFLLDLTVEQLAEAVEKMKETTEPNAYRPPYLQNVLAVLGHAEAEKYEILKDSPEKFARMRIVDRRKKARMMTRRSSLRHMMKGAPLSTQELRFIFISMLKSQYEHQINEGLLTSKHGLAVCLEQSLESAKNNVKKGGELNDLHYVQKFYKMVTKYANIANNGTRWLLCRGKKIG
jgi:NhaP-type Na+/H+ or K+/H+ antiporter